MTHPRVKKKKGITFNQNYQCRKSPNCCTCAEQRIIPSFRLTLMSHRQCCPRNIRWAAPQIPSTMRIICTYIHTNGKERERGERERRKKWIGTSDTFITYPRHVYGFVTEQWCWQGGHKFFVFASKGFFMGEVLLTKVEEKRGQERLKY
jgi:hypothetical protein